jgi:hypothetical protein
MSSKSLLYLLVTLPLWTRAEYSRGCTVIRLEFLLKNAVPTTATKREIPMSNIRMKMIVKIMKQFTPYIGEYTLIFG